MKKLTAEVEKDFYKRLKSIRKKCSPYEVITFPEIKIRSNHFHILNKNMFGFNSDLELLEYYRGKTHCRILLTESVFTTREDAPDFQYIFDLGMKALERGLHLDNISDFLFLKEVPPLNETDILEIEKKHQQ